MKNFKFIFLSNLKIKLHNKNIYNKIFDKYVDFFFKKIENHLGLKLGLKLISSIEEKSPNFSSLSPYDALMR